MNYAAKGDGNVRNRFAKCGKDDNSTVVAALGNTSAYNSASCRITKNARFNAAILESLASSLSIFETSTDRIGDIIPNALWMASTDLDTCLVACCGDVCSLYTRCS